MTRPTKDVVWKEFPRMTHFKPRLLKTVIVSASACLAVAEANAAAPSSETAPMELNQLTRISWQPITPVESEEAVINAQFMGGRRTDYSRRGRYKGARTRFSRKRLPRGAAATFGPSKFTHGETFTGGQGVRITKFDNGFHARRKIRQRVR